MRQTTIVNKENSNKKWFVVDAENQVLGRLASLVASVLRGKTKPTFTPNADMGDNVIIINAEKVKLTGKKEKNKVYYSHSGYPGGLKARTAEKITWRKAYSFIRKSN